MQENDESLVAEAQPVAPSRAHGHDLTLVGLPVEHEHFRLDAVVVQGFRKAIGRNSRAAREFGGIDD